MGGVCERPGCSQAAAAAVAVDPRRSIVWVGDLETSGDRVNKLCAVHADTLAAPLGWDRRDIREAPRLFAVPSSTEPPTPPRPTRRRRPKVDAAPVEAAVGVSAPTAAPTSAARPQDPRTQPLRPARPATATTTAAGGPTAGGATTVAPSMVAGGGPAAPPAHLGDLHRGDAELSAGAAALLDAGLDTPLLARAFRTARAAG